MGEEIQIPMTAWRACDTKYHSGVTDAGGFDTENGFSCESSQENVLKLEGFENHVLGQSGTALIRLVPQAAGMATVTIRVHAGGESKSVSFPVEVTNEKLAATSARTAKERVGVGDRVQIIPLHILDSGRTTDTPSIVTSYESLTPNLARVEEDYLVALGEGTARIKVTARFGGVSVEYILEVPILSLYMTDLSITAGGSDYVKLNGEKTPLFVTPIDNTGQAMDASGAEITWQALTPDILSIDGDGFLSAHKQGEGRVSATVSLNGDTLTKEATIRTIVGKSEPTLVSMEKRQNAIENGSRYPWARAEIDTYVKTAEEFVQKEDALWNMVVSEGIPRSMVVGIESDPKLYYCRYCDTDLLAKYGAYAFRCDPWGNPWKVQCPDCRRWFPSNDFGGFYQLGLNEYGEFSLDRAKARNEELVAAGQDGYLKHSL